MKFCIRLLASALLPALLLVSCATSTPTTTAAKSTLAFAQKNSSVSSHKLAEYFDESRTLNKATAVTKLIQSATQEPGNPEPLYSLGYLHMQSGISEKNKRELELAEIYLNEVLTQLPGNSAVLAALYNVYYESILREYAPTAFENAKAIFIQLPESSKATTNPPSLAKFVATALEQEKKRELNMQALRDILLVAIQESPLNDTPYIHLAKLYSDDRYFSLALATLKLGAENIRTSADLYKAIADTYVKRAEVNGCSYEHTSDIKNAAKYYLLAIPLKPDDQFLHVALSESFLDQNRNQLGLSEAKIALDLKPSSAALGLYAQNLSMLGSVSSQAADFSDDLYLRLDAYKINGNKSEADFKSQLMRDGYGVTFNKYDVDRTGGQITIGYKWSENIYTEVGYLDLGDVYVNLRLDGNVDQNAFGKSFARHYPTTASGAILVQGLRMPFNERWSVSPEVGVFIWKEEVDVNGATFRVGDKSNENLLVGVRLDYQVTDSFGLGLGVRSLLFSTDTVNVWGVSTRWDF